MVISKTKSYGKKERNILIILQLKTVEYGKTRQRKSIYREFVMFVIRHHESNAVILTKAHVDFSNIILATVIKVKYSL
jgi:hypothetical protein